jgi:DNA repair protein RadC
MLEEQLRSLNREELHMIMLDIRTGSSNCAHVRRWFDFWGYSQRLFREAVKANAAGIILVHNHPSGDSSPSRDDIESTLRLIEMGQLMGIKVIDHLVIAVSGCTSLKQEGHI